MSTDVLWFDTPLGQCGLAWNDHAIVRAYLPDGRRHESSAAPPQFVLDAARLIRRLLAGEKADLSAVPIDLSGVPEFHRAVYDVTATIPPGRTLTYGQVAERIGQPGAAQAVGRALGANPIPIIVPCHRVVGAGGRMVGFSAPGGIDTKRRLLVLEGACADAPVLF